MTSLMGHHLSQSHCQRMPPPPCSPPSQLAKVLQRASLDLSGATAWYASPVDGRGQCFLHAVCPHFLQFTAYPGAYGGMAPPGWEDAVWVKDVRRIPAIGMKGSSPLSQTYPLSLNCRPNDVRAGPNAWT